MKKIKQLLATDMNPAKTSSPAGVKVYSAAAAAQDGCTERHTTRRAKKRLPGVLNLVHTGIFAAISASAPALAYTIKATAIGISSHASGANSTAIGYGSGANSELSTAIGYGAASYGKNSFAMGANALTVGEGAIALGANSYANTEAGQTGYDPSGETHTGSAWVSTDGAMSIGNANTGSTRQIQNVAPVPLIRMP